MKSVLAKMFKSVLFFIAIANFSNAFSVDPSKFFNNDFYSSWYGKSGQNYNMSSFVNSTSQSDTGVGLLWTIDSSSKKIKLAVVCPVGNGWCGIGIAEAGGMKGSDMVIFESQSQTLYDAHVLDDINAGPIRDDCQNWLLKDSTSSGEDENGIMIFEAQRDLDTLDSFDRAFIDDSNLIVPPTRVIAAWGTTPSVSYHGKNRAKSTIRFFNTQPSDGEATFLQAMKEQAEGSFEISAQDYEIPTNETTYAYFCFMYADLIAKGVPEDADLHIIGFEPIIDKDTSQYVHHFVMTGSPDPNVNITSPVPTDVCENLPTTELSYAWAPGDGSFEFPKNIGGLLGTKGFRTFQLQTHYNNPDQDSGKIDSSGVRVYWTSKKREYDMGILQLGDPNVALYGQPVGSGLTEHTFDCPSSCSSAYVSNPVTVLREHLHMHKAGTMIYNELIRNGTVVHTGAVDFFDFHQQGDPAVQQEPFQILPGDSFRTRCYFEANNEVWGLGSQDEMCIG